MLFTKNQKTELYLRVKDDQYELRRILFEGTFISKERKKISFLRNGKIEGLKDFAYFEVAYDFTEGIEFDAIYCYSSEARPEYYPQVYKFKFINQELLLYEVQTDWETLERKVSAKPIRLKRL